MHPLHRPRSSSSLPFPPPPINRLLGVLISALVALMMAVTSAVALAAPATAGNKVTPGALTGYGFDQCLAPEQSKMDRWMSHSPYLAVGIYISGYSRGCPDQPNLSPSWITHQLNQGWRLLPITLGPQASCSTRYPRYGYDHTIDPDPTNNYAKARRMGRDEAEKTMTRALNLGIARHSVLWYDIEAFDIGKDRCRESALRFLSAWSHKLHAGDFKSGVYSSAASGVKMLDDARVNRPGKFVLPDYIWIGDWDDRANTDSAYVRDGGWRPHRRVKQFQGGHAETWGGVTIDVDRDFLNVGQGSHSIGSPKACRHTTNLDFYSYRKLARGSDRTAQVRALQCLLRKQGLYDGRLTGNYGDATVKAAKAFQSNYGSASATWRIRDWARLLSVGPRPVLKWGSMGRSVRRLQRVLNARLGSPRIAVTGHFNGETKTAVLKFQMNLGLGANGVVAYATWRRLRALSLG